MENEKTDPLQDLLDMWKVDAKFDRTDPGAELTKIGSLHSKYLSLLSMNRQSVKNMERKIKKLKKVKWEYYTGKLDAETLKKYNWTPFPYVLKADISIYLEADTDLLEFNKIKDLHEEIAEVCSSILKELSSRTWQAKDIITWERFIQGAH